jgi:hypothetical protein
LTSNSQAIGCSSIPGAIRLKVKRFLPSALRRCGSEASGLCQLN